MAVTEGAYGACQWKGGFYFIPMRSVERCQQDKAKKKIERERKKLR